MEDEVSKAQDDIPLPDQPDIIDFDDEMREDKGCWGWGERYEGVDDDVVMGEDGDEMIKVDDNAGDNGVSHMGGKQKQLQEQHKMKLRIKEVEVHVASELVKVHQAEVEMLHLKL
ncbi:hypothetical protein HYDPIDRAFT_170955 [Hydnomerulius pinastri MD-312]|uniref:Uncharacterized protein n=1 Tax=Hydnomerulius pinastri MD-312 TaxID=994086 RepID=A0A0C9W040_9AGAM|nr:hypothetical protein HYDPIDRAFT_170955 [Hydnomerulius pinastri MD-312]